MVRRRTPVVDGLEQRTLLSSIAYSLTTDQAVYQVGQPIELTFTETNISNQPVTLAWGEQLGAVPYPDTIGFTITHNGTAVLWSLPGDDIELDPPPTFTLQPGQSLTVPETWDGLPMFGPYTMSNLIGNFVVGYGPASNPTQLTTTFQIVPPPSSELATSVTTDQTSYILGQSVNLTFTETNIGDQPLTILTGGNGFNITQSGVTLFSTSSRLISDPSWSTLAPGQSYSQTATWNGLPTTAPLASLAAPFTVSNDFTLTRIRRHFSMSCRRQPIWPPA